MKITEFLSQGAHLISPRSGYTHHGIYIGDGLVIHYAGLANGLESGPIEITTFERFTYGKPVNIRKHVVRRYSGQEVVNRAKSRLGERGYNLATNNCEHFCTWAWTGDNFSPQVVAFGVGTVAGPIGKKIAETLASAGSYTDFSYDRESPVDPEMEELILRIAKKVLPNLENYSPKESQDQYDLLEVTFELEMKLNFNNGFTLDYTDAITCFRNIAQAAQKMRAEDSMSDGVYPEGYLKEPPLLYNAPANLLSDQEAFVFARMAPVIADYFGVTTSSITPSTHLVFDLNADSLDMMEILISADEIFGIEISEEISEPIETLKDAIQLIARLNFAN